MTNMCWKYSIGCTNGCQQPKNIVISPW